LKERGFTFGLLSIKIVWTLNSDGNLIMIALGTIAMITAIIQYIGSKWITGRGYLRKLLHCSVILICAYVIGFIQDPFMLQWIFLGFVLVLLIVVRTKLLNISQGNSYGIALFPLAFAILLMIDGLPRSYIVISAIVLAIADPIAGLIGQTYAKSFWVPLEEKKSWVGSVSFFIASAIIFWCLGHRLIGESSLSLGLTAILLLSLLVTLSEMFSWRGSDNLMIPIVSAISLQALAIHGLDGAVISPWALVLPIVFLIFGSLLSRLNKGESSIAKDDSSGRNAHQVFANGGMAMIMAVPYLLTHKEVYLVLFSLVFAITLSDTASSEIGRRIKGPTWSLKTLKKVIPGESGGISLMGTVGGAIGALIIGAIAYHTFSLSSEEMFWIVLLGFLGMIVDSLLGAFVQGKYMIHGILLEKGNRSQLVSGYHWIDNSMVNFLSVLIITILAYMLL